MASAKTLALRAIQPHDRPGTNRTTGKPLKQAGRSARQHGIHRERYLSAFHARAFLVHRKMHRAMG